VVPVRGILWGLLFSAVLWSAIFAAVVGPTHHAPKPTPAVTRDSGDECRAGLDPYDPSWWPICNPNSPTNQLKEGTS
jgi:hypothetical protein